MPKPCMRGRPEFKIEWNASRRGPSGEISDSGNSVKSRGELWWSFRAFLIAATINYESVRDRGLCIVNIVSVVL